jgi:hypothetical protein
MVISESSIANRRLGANTGGASSNNEVLDARGLQDHFQLSLIEAADAVFAHSRVAAVQGCAKSHNSGAIIRPASRNTMTLGAVHPARGYVTSSCWQTELVPRPLQLRMTSCQKDGLSPFFPFPSPVSALRGATTSRVITRCGVFNRSRLFRLYSVDVSNWRREPQAHDVGEGPSIPR